MLKGPHALLEPKLDMISEISLASHGLSIRLDGFGAPRYVWNEDLALGILFSIEGPMLTK